jgi:hypothetical protein
MATIIKVKYVGKKPFAVDNVARSGKCWNGPGDVQEVTDAQALILTSYADQWGLVDEADSSAIEALEPIHTDMGDGTEVDVDPSALSKPLETMTKAELVAFSMERFNQKLDGRSSTKQLIDCIEEFQRTMQPVV